MFEMFERDLVELPYPSLFGSLATRGLVEIIPVGCCHTLLFSGHLQQPGCPARTEDYEMLPYPSLFGSLATKTYW